MVIRHTPESPFVFVGNGLFSFRGHLGNFVIEDYVQERIPLRNFSFAEESENVVRIVFHRDGLMKTEVSFTAEEHSLGDVITFGALPADANHIWVRFLAEETEHVFGGGEQFSYFDLRGHTFPLWIQEQGVGRNKSTLVTFKDDRNDGGGGDYYTTYWAQPTFTSSRLYSCHFDTTSYSEFDFRHSGFHEVQIWDRRPGRIYLGASDSFAGLVGRVAAFLGRQPVLPKWTQDGAILGVQGGTAAMLEYLKQAQGNSTLVNGLWIQDWVGRIKTSFGRRLFWNWEWDREHYPNLDKEIVRLRTQGVKVFAYINPNLNREGSLFKEADSQSFLVRNSSGQTYVVDFGEFFCGIVDMTNPAAFKWYKGVIRKNMIDLGFGGWMADFGEYLPTDAVFHNGQPGDEVHNLWPVLWAKLNREVAEEAGLASDLLIWMRAGFSGSQRYATMTWAGDQFVDFSLADGLASVIPAALSLGMSGFGLTHFDIGGYTSMFGIGRTKELLLRYAEFAAFTPVMRTHEGNRPDANWQFYSSPDTTRAFARHTRIFHALSEYTQAVIHENAETGIPTQRPLFMHYANDEKSYSIKYEYLYGRDLLVSPVYHEGVDTWSVYLPPDDWVFLWDGKEYVGGTVTVAAPLGKIPVFYRKGSPWTSVFQKLHNLGVADDPIVSTMEERNNEPQEGGLLQTTVGITVASVLLFLLARWYCLGHPLLRRLGIQNRQR
ncbi:sulfoquinovosidase-like isoform X2 [Patiria miniata]|uniref:Alpha-glucosidase n=1 Tax=Patiria miniata TaxID=46514 RepID=A0A914BGL7_PATMI|nr:sulfoquinovosidase-like isoform X2 [Patiria miniata]